MTDKELILKEIKQKIISDAEFASYTPVKTGGQSTGRVIIRQRLRSEELDLTIELGYYRSHLRNREVLQTIFELMVDEIIK